jgi:RNA polymerase sigma-70 factor (ECF subfamily)
MTVIEQLYRRHARDVYRFAFWLCGNVAEAEDLTSETFVRAIVGADQLKTATVKAYLLAIARNLFLQGRRRSQHQLEPDQDLPDPAPGPEQRAQQEDELRFVMRAVQDLPEIDRTAFLMRIEHDLPYEEIARLLGLSLSAAKVKVHRARIRLASLRGGEGGVS